MSYTLYGSYPSPFVRRIRMAMENIPFDFKEMNIYEGQDAVDLNKINPVNQIPVLTDGDQVIWDSRQIFYYLQKKHNLQALSLDEENRLTAIEGAMNAGVSLLLMKRSGININENFMYVVRLKDRINSVLDYLKPYLQGAALTDWNFSSMSLYSFIDWAVFRGVLSIEDRPECQKFQDHWSTKEIVIKTQIPRI